MAREDASLSLDFLKLSSRFIEPSADFESEIGPHVELLINKVEELSSLDEGWMGYQSAAPSAKSIAGAAFFIAKMLRPDIPTPDIFPCPNGNIQLEWSCFDIDFEVEIESKTQYHVAFEDLATGECWDETFTYDLSEITKILLLLLERQSAIAKGPMSVHG